MTPLGQVEFHVDQVVIDVALSDAQAKRLTPVLKAAFEDLAQRLKGVPAERFHGAPRFALRQLRVHSLPADELLGPRGAAKLADAFWAQFNASWSAR